MNDSSHEGLSDVDKIVTDTLLSPRPSESPLVLLVLEGAKARVDAKNGIQSALFLGFLYLASKGANEEQIRSAGAKIRALVSDAIRQSTRASPAGETQVGSEGVGFSTPTVYASIVAKMLRARNEGPNFWKDAMSKVPVRKRKDANRIHEATGFYESVVVCREVLKTYEQLRKHDLHEKYPALLHAEKFD
jgi:hypothetical protein